MNGTTGLVKLFIEVLSLVVGLFVMIACHTPQTSDSSEQAAAKEDNQSVVEFKAAQSHPVTPTPAPAEVKEPEAAKEETAAEPPKPAAEKPVAASALAVKPPKDESPDAKEESAPAKARVTLAGCLQKSKRRGGGELSHQPTGGPPVDSVKIEKKAGSITVIHDLTHNCCFEADVHTSVKGASVWVVEKLSGKVCRCMCNSTIRTDIELKKNTTYTVRVDVDENGVDRKVHEEKISL
jgi:hypothetical protein